jgi:hypothetical protein
MSRNARCWCRPPSAGNSGGLDLPQPPSTQLGGSQRPRYPKGCIERDPRRGWIVFERYCSVWVEVLCFIELDNLLTPVSVISDRVERATLTRWHQFGKRHPAQLAVGRSQVIPDWPALRNARSTEPGRALLPLQNCPKAF